MKRTYIYISIFLTSCTPTRVRVCTPPRTRVREARGAKSQKGLVRAVGEVALHLAGNHFAHHDAAHDDGRGAGPVRQDQCPFRPLRRLRGSWSISAPTFHHLALCPLARHVVRFLHADCYSDQRGGLPRILDLGRRQQCFAGLRQPTQCQERHGRGLPAVADLAVAATPRPRAPPDLGHAGARPPFPPDRRPVLK